MSDPKHQETFSTAKNEAKQPDPEEQPLPELIISGTIIKQGVDSQGRHFTPECLEAAFTDVDERLALGVEIFAFEGFHQKLASVQGKLVSIGYQRGQGDQPAAITGGVEVMGTPAGLRTRKKHANLEHDSLAIALMGTCKMRALPAEGEESQTPMEYTDVKITGLSIMPESQKEHNKPESDDE